MKVDVETLEFCGSKCPLLELEYEDKYTNGRVTERKYYCGNIEKCLEIIKARQDYYKNIQRD